MQLTFPLFAVRTPMGGTESSIYNFTRALRAAGTDLTVALSTNDYLAPEFVAWLDSQPVTINRYPTFGAHHQLRFLEESWFALFDRSSHVLYPNYFIPPLRPGHGFNGAIILDIQCKTFPEYFSANRRRWLELNHRRMVRHADRILFISEFERQQFFRHYGDGYADRTDVVHVPIDWSRYDGEPSEAIRELTTRRYILAVSHPYPHKNIETLIGAFAILSKHDKDLLLVLAGKPSASLMAAASAVLDGQQLARVHFTGFISDADVGALYRSANVFATPSRYEGFGMPAVEALGFGVPVLVSDAGSLKEVTLGKANYLAPQASAGEWADSLRSLLDTSGNQALADEVRAEYSPFAIGTRIITSMTR